MKRKPGRPTKFKPEYCQMLEKHMEEGLSFEAFGGLIRVAKQTLYTWAEQYPEFLDAKRVGESLARLFWEKRARDEMYSETFKDDQGMTVSKAPSAPIMIFNLKNRLGWRDRQPDEDGDERGAPSAQAAPMTPDQIVELVKAARGEK